MDEKVIQLLKKRIKTLTSRGEPIYEYLIELQTRKIAQAKSIDALTALVAINFISDRANQEDMNAFYDLVDKAFNFGIDFGLGKNDKIAQGLSEMAVSSSQEYMTKLGNDIKDDALRVIEDGLANGFTIEDIKGQLTQDLLISKSRANTIARTEMARAANSASYIQSKANGAMFYVVDNRAEACEECQDLYEGQVFPIDDIGNLPPVHPNCACVPVYFTDEGMAQEWTDNLQQWDEELRQKLEDEGYKIAPDGTSNNTNDNQVLPNLDKEG